MPIKVITAEEWKALGLPTETWTIHVGNTKLLKKFKENNKKKFKKNSFKK